MTVPDAPAPGPMPVVIFGHGLVTERRFVLAVGSALAAKGFAEPGSRLLDQATGTALPGTIVATLSGPSFARDHTAHGGDALPSPQIVAAAAAGDATAAASLDRYVDRLARALATVINIFDPEVVVLGGGMSQIAALYEAVPAVWGRWIFSDTVETRLRPPVHGDSSGVRGAAWLWPP
jgi:predicted NBD/HSP70 family sugar kinase